VSAATTTPAEAIAARGIPIPLSDGSTVHLRYTMASLMALEDEFGNVARIMSDVKGAATALEASFAIAQGTATPEQVDYDATYTGPSVFSVLVRALAPGLLDAPATDPRDGTELWLGEHPDVVARMLDTAHLQQYMNAFGAAFNQAFGAQAVDLDAAAKGGDANPPAKATPRSRGASGGTSQSAAPRSNRTRSGG
jgi:hypothetical protein